MVAAGLGLLPAVWGALLQEGIDMTVILNALRALHPVASGVRLDASGTEIARQVRRLLYGLDAVLRMRTAQEDESYLSLGDDASAATPVPSSGASP